MREYKKFGISKYDIGILGNWKIGKLENWNIGILGF